jgi:elongation factor Ts
VSKNEEFLAFAEQALEAVEEGGEGALEALDAERQELIGRLGENVVVVGAARLEALEGESLAEYVHPPANKIGVLVRVRGDDPVEARRVAMHISFSNPRYLTRQNVPEEDVAAEREIYANSDEVLAKPENVRDKIVDGMLQKRFYADTVLAEQAWIHDTAKTVAQALADAGLELLDFRRFSVAG